MFKLLNKKKNNKGFTLVELVIVIAILAILVGILAPQYTKYVEKSRKSADASNLEEMVKAVQVYDADTDHASIATGSYEIKMTTTEVTVADALKPALEASVPDYASKKLKSARWGTKNEISATITIEATTGKMTVDYEPDEMKKMAGTATVTTKPAGGSDTGSEG